MIFNKEKLKIYCPLCNKWIDKIMNVLIIEDIVYCMNCYENWQEQQLGFKWDIYPCEYYYFYHNKPQCRCVQEECNCFGNEDKCDNLWGKRCYKSDLEEEKNDLPKR